MEHNIEEFKHKLEILEKMLNNMSGPFVTKNKVQELKKSVYVLRRILADEHNIVSPYGPPTAIAPMSLN